MRTYTPKHDSIYINFSNEGITPHFSKVRKSLSKKHYINIVFSSKDILMLLKCKKNIDLILGDYVFFLSTIALKFIFL